MDKFGEISWSDSLGGEQRTNNKDLFLKLSPGSNIVRVVTAPHQYMLHKWKPEGDPGFGYRFVCSKVHGACPICEKGDKAKRRWYLGVIDRKSGTYKVLDVGVSVLKSIQSLVKDEDWGDPNKYDIDIKTDPKAGPSGYYTVNPKPHKALSASDLQIKDTADLDQLKRLSAPPTPEKVQERLDKILSNAGMTLRVADQSENMKIDVSADDSADDFPAFDAQSKSSF